MPDNPQPSKESVEAATIIASEWWNADIESQDQLPKLLDLIAAGIDEAYRRGRESMREEAARLGEAAASTLMLRETPRYEGDDGPATLRTVQGIGQAIRSLPLTEVKK